MKRPLLFTLFFICTPVLLAARVLQQIYMIDTVTGFYKDDFGYVGNIITIVCLLLIPVLLLTVWLSRPTAVVPNVRSKALGIASFFATICLAISGVTQIITATHSGYFALAIMSFATAAVIVLHGIACFTDGKFNGWLTIVCVIYGLTRLVITFMGYTGEVTVTDTLFDIATMALLLLFFYSSGKIIAGVAGPRTPVLFYAYGLSAAFFCVDSFLAPAIVKFMGDGFAIHSGGHFDLSYLGFAVYIIVMIYVYSGDKAKVAVTNEPDEISIINM